MELTLIFHFARFLIVFPFIFSGFFSLLNFKETIDHMKSKKIPFPFLGLIGAIFLKIFCSLMIIFSTHSSVAAYALIIFTIICTIIFHDFWTRKGIERKFEIFAVVTIMAWIGGLLLLAVTS